MLLCWCPFVPPAAADFYLLKACMLTAAVTSVSMALHVAFSSELLLAFQVHVADTQRCTGEALLVSPESALRLAST